MKRNIFAFVWLVTLATNLSAQTFTTLHSFTRSDGYDPDAGLILSGSTLYGTASGGGNFGSGTVFKINTDSSGFTNLYNFNGIDGWIPVAGLIVSGNTLYGTTSVGGGFGGGTVFKVNTDGTGFTNLHIFTALGLDGRHPDGGLILSGNTLYGTANGGGSSGNGTVFKINTDGTSFTVLYNFTALSSSGTNADGAFPTTGLILSGNTLYGTASAGGTGGIGFLPASTGGGTVFKVNTDGSGFMTLHSISWTMEGASPKGLVLSGSTLYGTTSENIFGSGIVFALNTNGSNFTNLHRFATISGSFSTNYDGSNPQAGLILSGNTLYGTTELGGSGNGTVFAVNTDGTGFTNLHNFTGVNDGANPYAGLILSGNTLYGTASSGGISGNGTVFALSLGPSPPIITIQPQSQTPQAGNNVNLTVAVAGSTPINYQWQFNGQNILNATNATLTLNSVTAANDGGYSVVVSNPYGSVTSATASLAVLSPDLSVQCFLMTATPLPPRQASKNNLIVVTHGFELEGTNADISWITNLCNDISDKLVSSGSNDWQVIPYAWLDKAGLPVWYNTLGDLVSLPLVSLGDPALHNAENIGTQIGEQIAEQGWAHVHLIGHSAGAGLIQKAAEAIRKNSPGTVIQTTFLDPFLGLDYHGFIEYGSDAAWSDNYFDHDTVTGSYTEGTLPNCFNVNVTWSETSPDITTIYDSIGFPIGCDAQTPLFDSHEYPHEYYDETVFGTQKSCSVGLGFALSKEAGGWNNHGIYSFGQLLSPCEQCPSITINNQFPTVFNPQINLNLSPYATSLSGAGGINLSGFTLNSSLSPQAQVKSGGIQPMDQTSTNTPAWLAVGMSVTNAVNFVQFNAAFTDTNSAQGLLTVYWNTNQVGMVDERVAETNSQTYRFEMPGTVSGGLYTLSFRLDSFDNSSSIAVTNVTTGFVGVTQPITLGISLTNGAPLLQLTAATNFTYLIQSSTDLVNWTPTALLLNTNGMVQFMDSAVTNSGARFYRAVLP